MFDDNIKVVFKETGCGIDVSTRPRCGIMLAR